MAAAERTKASSSMPVTTMPGNEIWRSDRERPLAASPRPSAGSVTSRRYRSVVNEWASRPSPTSPATSVMRGPTAARKTGGFPYGLGPGSNIGVISVWR